MPEGRMLKKVVSTSQKLANLKSDSARLLYTWLIPHLDIEGRFSADPKIVKGYVVPRLKMSIHEVAKHLEDMEYNNLISIYEVNGDLFMELIKFKNFQTLNPKRESPSLIPLPQKIKRREFKDEEYEFAWGQWEKNKMLCPICKKKGKFIAGKGIVIDGYIPFQIDHKIPISKGGKFIKENLWVICQKCNAKKGNKILALDLLRTNSSTSKLKESKLKESKLNSLCLEKVPNEVDIQLTQLLIDLMQENDPKSYIIQNLTENRQAKWINQCRLLREKDGRTEEEIEMIIRWCQKDNFWKGNILSMPTLREKFSQLWLKAKKEKFSGIKEWLNEHQK